MTRTVAILVFDDVEVLDFSGPFEVFSTARPDGENADECRLFDVVTVAVKAGTVTCRGGLLVQPHYTIAEKVTTDILLLPGGMGTRRERTNSRLLEWIATQSKHAELTTSVCTGAFLLAACGLLDGRKATTHWASIEWMRETYTSVNMQSNVRFVDEGDIITSAGVSAGIDMALHVVSRLHGQEAAAWTARRMEYDWRPGN